MIAKHRHQGVVPDHVDRHPAIGRQRDERQNGAPREAGEPAAYVPLVSGLSGLLRNDVGADDETAARSGRRVHRGGVDDDSSGRPRDLLASKHGGRPACGAKVAQDPGLLSTRDAGRDADPAGADLR